MIDKLSTAEAASYLGVSEASVRRWADQGTLAVERVGRRQERRFLEQDLRRFAAGGRSTGRRGGSPRASVMARIGGLNVHAGTHLAVFYDSDPARLRIAVPFLCEGLRLGQPGILVATGAARAAFLGAIHEELGAALEVATSTGLFEVWSKPGDTPKSALEKWEARLWKARSAGHPMMRIVGDVASAAEGFGSAAKMLAFENSLTPVIKRFATVVLCTYDVRLLDGRTVLEAMRVHSDMFAFGLQDFLA